jgi:ElaB/YqjD/DUF883 family membrane-anchored ribosome-binding protein/vacuolar-type H+-ATPase subunit E/Vma4
MEETVEIAGVDAHRAGIEQTRADISGTLDAIKDKLQPQTLIQQAKESAQEVTAGVAEKAKSVVEHARDSAQEVVQQAKETVHSAMQEAREAIPEAAHHAVHNAVDTAKDAVGGVMDSAKEAVSGVVDTAKDAGTTVVETVRTNPMPYALIGLGLGLLYMNSRRPGPRTRRLHELHALAENQPTSGYPRSTGGNPNGYGHETGARYRGSADTHWDTQRWDDARSERSVVSDTVRQAREKIGDVAETVQEKAGQMAGHVQDKAGQVVGHVQETVSDLRDRTADQAHDMAQGFQRTLEENPLLVGAIALGIGAAVGFMMPETQPENRFMGEARDRLVENVQQTAHEVVEKVQNVASETLDTAKEKAQDVAAEVIDTAKDEARNQGLMPSESTTSNAGAAANTGSA